MWARDRPSRRVRQGDEERASPPAPAGSAGAQRPWGRPALLSARATCLQGVVHLNCWEAASSPWVGLSFPVCRPGDPGLPDLLALSQVTWLSCDRTEPLSPALSRPLSFPRGGKLRSVAALFVEPPGGPRAQAGESLQPTGCFAPVGSSEGAARSWASWMKTGHWRHLQERGCWGAGIRVLYALLEREREREGGERERRERERERGND